MRYLFNVVINILRCLITFYNVSTFFAITSLRMYKMEKSNTIVSSENAYTENGSYCGEWMVLGMYMYMLPLNKLG
jgi:hypothetical protein